MAQQHFPRQGHLLYSSDEQIARLLAAADLQISTPCERRARRPARQVVFHVLTASVNDVDLGCLRRRARCRPGDRRRSPPSSGMPTRTRARQADHDRPDRLRRVSWSGARLRRRTGREASAFRPSEPRILASRPVSLFSSGPLGTEAADAKGRDLTVAAEPEDAGRVRPSRPRAITCSLRSLDPGTLGFSDSGDQEAASRPHDASPRATSATGPRSMPRRATSPTS